MPQPAPTLGFSYIEQFRCLADQCEDSCCNGNWRISVNDDQAQNYHDHYPSLYHIIAKDDSGYYMQSNESGCMAQEKGLCIIHRDHGEFLLPDTCANYPRMYRSISQFYTRSGTMSCPEVARKCLFDDTPFALVPSELPEHHKDGAKLHQQDIPGLDQALWQETVSSLIQLTLDDDKTIEEILTRLRQLAPTLSTHPVSDWPHSIASTTNNPLDTRAHHPPQNDPVAQAEHTTDLLYMLLENLDHPTATAEHLRQLAAGAFEVHSQDEQGRPRCQLKPEFKHYYQGDGRRWIQSALKRFVTGEITRNGFPFISTTSGGKDYGHSLVEWTTTLCLRTLSLRLLLSICGTHYATDHNSLPDEHSITTWVYSFCRKVNHRETGTNEMKLRQVALENDAERLYEYLDVL